MNDNGDWKDFPGSAKAGASALAAPYNITESAYTDQLKLNFPSETVGVPTRVRMLIRKAPGTEHMVNPHSSAIWSFMTDFASLCVFMGYSGLVVFLCVAC